MGISSQVLARLLPSSYVQRAILEANVQRREGGKGAPHGRRVDLCWAEGGGGPADRLGVELTADVALRSGALGGGTCHSDFIDTMLPRHDSAAASNSERQGKGK
jgi:hypothetical protein